MIKLTELSAIGGSIKGVNYVSIYTGYFTGGIRRKEK
jgi:hypothetical protein